MNWPPSNRALTGQVVELEPIEERHRAPLAEAAADSRIWEWMDRRPATDADGFDNWFEARMAVSGAADEWCYVTRDTESGKTIGSSSYLNVRLPHDGLEIGWSWLSPSAWRSGANREMKLLMLTEAFESLGCMRVEFKTDARNERSRAALEGIGAGFEGVFRKHMLVPGVGERDSAYFSITTDDWPSVREGLQTSLSSHANSDSTGANA